MSTPFYTAQQRLLANGKIALRNHNVVMFPNYRVIVTKADADAKELTLRVPPKLTKHEIRDYVEQVHRLPVVSISTVNYDQKTKAYGIRRIPYRAPAYKKAIVKLATTDKIQSPSTAVPPASTSSSS